MARIRFDENYVSGELEKVGNALIKPVDLYLLGGAAMIRYGLKAATKDIEMQVQVTANVVKQFLVPPTIGL